MNKTKTDFLLLGLSVLYMIALLTVLHACDAREDGSRMSCYIAWMCLLITAVIDIILSLIHFIVSDLNIKRILDLGIFVISAVIFLIPGRIVELCMMPDMHCRAVMRPGSIVFAIILLLAANMDLTSLQKQY